MIKFARKLNQAKSKTQQELSIAWKALCSQMDREALEAMRLRYARAFGEHNQSVKYIDTLLSARRRNDRTLYGL